MTKDEAMKLALDALEGVRIEYDFHGNPLYDEDKKIDPASTASFIVSMWFTLPSPAKFLAVLFLVHP